jgi:formiminoglutamase
MSISMYLEPVNLPDYGVSGNSEHKHFGEILGIYTTGGQFPDLENVDLAIIGINEDRNSVNNEGCGLAPDYVRSFFYRLFPGNYTARIVDLGNIKRGHSVDDTYFALSTVVADLLASHIVPILIGGGQDLTYANYKAYESLGRIINIVSVDNAFDLGENEKKVSSQSFLSRIILHQPNYLFNYTNIGYQTYFVDQDAINLMNKLFFDAYRLGVVQKNITMVEPLVRNADMLTFDISGIRMSDAPAGGNASPNGFYGEEACQIARYAGMSDKLSSAGFYEMNPTFDRQGQTAHLLAQMIWYFVDGYYHRSQDFPGEDVDGFIRFTVQVSGHDDGIVFYKSKQSGRWWMEIDCSPIVKAKFGHHYLVPCDYSDYTTACADEIPDRWWQMYQKLM